MKKPRLAAGAFLLAAAVLALACFDAPRPLASDYVRESSQALPAATDSALKTALAPQISAHPGESGFKLLPTGADSLAARLALIEAAQRSLDIQYYIVQDDHTGKLLLEAILRAADRGVRVRLLMDDLNLRGSDTTWPLLNAHQNLDIRIFNPFATRDQSFPARIKNLFTSLGKFSKRMHNKTMIADNQLAITGGRNLGDEYFDAGSDFNFRDVDVMAAGPIVPQLSHSFDLYWNDEEAFPIGALFKAPEDPQAVAKLRGELQRHWQEESEKGMIVPHTPLAEQLGSGKVPLVWGEAELAADNPAKIDTPVPLSHSKPASSLNELAQSVEHEFLIVSPYFVPGPDGTQGLIGLVKRGVDVRVLTNSLGSTDVVATYNGYSHYRAALAEGGIQLYEMQPVPGTHPHSHGFSSASRNSLHSKIYIADRRDVMIGSFNLDPRSVSLNTEMALVIHCPALAAQLASMFDKATSPSASFHIVLKDHKILWISEKDGRGIENAQEPEAGFWRKMKARLFNLLPLDSQL